MHNMAQQRLSNDQNIINREICQDQPSDGKAFHPVAVPNRADIISIGEDSSGSQSHCCLSHFQAGLLSSIIADCHHS